MIEFLATSPSDAEVLVDLGWFPNREKASACLRSYFRRGLLRFREFVQMDNGQYRLVYAKNRVANPAHEHRLTVFGSKLIVDEQYRGADVNRDFQADIEMVVNGQVFYGELDRDTEGRPQVRRQMQRYQYVEADVLWICPNERRMRSLMTLTDARCVWFTTYEQSLTPHDAVWVNVHGETVALPMADGRAT